MLDSDSIQEILYRLQSPTYGAPSSELQLAALHASNSEIEVASSSISFDNLETTHVSTLQNTISQLEEDAAAILTIHSVLQTHRKNALRYFHSATAALAPINRFPPEILARIFLAGKHLELNFCPRISWVTKRWRDVALSTPELWNRIPLTSFPRVSTYVKRSGSTPLDIEVDARTYPINHFALKQSMDLLVQHLHRWRDIQVLLEDHDQASLVVGPLMKVYNQTENRFPGGQLSNIRIGVPYRPGSISRTYTSSITIAPNSTLRAIELLGVEMIYEPNTTSSVFQNMHTLSLSSVHDMHLEAHLLLALASMPALTSLTLDQCLFINSRLVNEAAPPIVLEELAILDFSVIPDEIANTIFSRLYAPKLQTFGWYSYRLGSPSSILDWEVIRMRYTTLSVLRLRNITSYATKSLLRWLQELPHLTSLTVIFGELLSVKNVTRSVEDVLNLLAQSQGCTMLKRLGIGNLDGNNLVKLQAVIQNRPCLQKGKVVVALQSGTSGSEKGEEFMEWVKVNPFNVDVHETAQDDEEGILELDSDDSDEEQSHA